MSGVIRDPVIQEWILYKGEACTFTIGLWFMYRAEADRDAQARVVHRRLRKRCKRQFRLPVMA